MKKLFLLIIIASTILSCTPSHYYTYKTVMISPVQSDSLVYENDSIKIKFVLQEKFILFIINNKLNEGIKINWDEVSFSVAGFTYRVVHKETGVNKVRDAQFATSIPPKSYLADGMIPADKLVYTNPNMMPAIKATFPDYDYGKKKIIAKIREMKGADVVIYLPMNISGKFVNGSYHLKIVDIIPYKAVGKRAYPSL